MKEQNEIGPDSVATERVSVEQLFRAHASFVASFLHRLGVPRSDVDDAVQEVFTIAHRKGGFEPGLATARTWLGAIALRVASGTKRKHARRREKLESSVLAATESQGTTAQQRLEARDSLARVQRALDTLDVSHRAVFVLYEIEGEDCSHIAECLGVAVGTVYSRLHTARRRFVQAHDDLVRAEGTPSEHEQLRLGSGALR